MKKQILAAALVAMLGLTACNEAEKTEKKDDVKATAAIVQTAPAAIASTAPTTKEDVIATVPADVVPTNPPPATEATTTKELNIDFNNRSLVVQGKKFTVGETTLQEILDNGFTFNEEINPDDQLNYRYSALLKLANERTAICTFIIPNDEPVPIKEGILESIKVGDLKGLPSDVELPLPKDVKLDDIIEKYGEPDHFDDTINSANYHSDDDSSALIIYFHDNENTILCGVELVLCKKMTNN